MTQYLVLLPVSESRYAAATNEELTDLGPAHGEFVELLGRRGHTVVDGAQLAPSHLSVVATGSAVDDVTVTEGPYAESAEQIGGYYLVESDDVHDLAQVCGRLLATPFHRAVEIRPVLSQATLQESPQDAAAPAEA